MARASEKSVMTYYEIIKRLIGPVNPVGDTYEDKKRFKNLRETAEIIDRLIFDVSSVTHDKDHHIESIAKAGKFADRFLINLYDSLRTKYDE